MYFSPNPCNVARLKTSVKSLERILLITIISVFLTISFFTALIVTLMVLVKLSLRKTNKVAVYLFIISSLSLLIYQATSDRLYTSWKIDSELATKRNYFEKDLTSDEIETIQTSNFYHSLLENLRKVILLSFSISTLLNFIFSIKQYNVEKNNISKVYLVSFSILFLGNFFVTLFIAPFAGMVIM